MVPRLLRGLTRAGVEPGREAPRGKPEEGAKILGLAHLARESAAPRPHRREEGIRLLGEAVHLRPQL